MERIYLDQRWKRSNYNEIEEVCLELALTRLTEYRKETGEQSVMLL